MTEQSTIDVPALTAERDEMAGRLNGLVEALEARGIKMAAEGEVTALAIEAIDKLQAEVAASAKKLASAQAKAKAVPSTKKGRKIGPIKDPVGPREDEEKGTISAPHVLLELIDDAETVEVAFSDGKNEIAELPALVVSGDGAWKVTPAGLQLTVEPVLLQSQNGRVDLRGYGLIIDGEQVAWRETGPHSLLPGRQQNVAGDIVFAG